MRGRGGPLARLFALGGAAVALAGAPAAGDEPEIALFGEAWIGLGYNVDNDGEPIGTGKVRAISRVRFGVAMTGETESGIVFGADVLADEAIGAEGGEHGQTEGNVFVSGDLGTLTLGDTEGADAQHVGDLNEVGLTCLGCQNETPFISNGGSFGDDALDFAENPEARPTIRYDYYFDGLGLSVSSNRDLDDIAIGAGWVGEIGEGTVEAGVGYFDFSPFTVISEEATVTLIDDAGRPVEVPAEVGSAVAGGHQWSAALGGEIGDLDGKLIWSKAESEGGGGFETLGVGLGADLGPWELNAYYNRILDVSGALEADFGEAESFGVGANYDLGGGAAVKSGMVRDYGDEVLADFGIELAF